MEAMRSAKNKKSNSIRLSTAVFICILLLLTVPVAIGTTLLLKVVAPAKVQQAITETVVESSGMTAQKAVSEIQAAIIGAGACQDGSSNPIPYLVNGYDLAVYPDTDKVECVESELTADKKDAAEKQLKDFAQEWGMEVPYKSGDFQAIITDDIVCNIDTNLVSTKDGKSSADSGYSLVVSCADIASYTDTASRSKEMQQAYETAKSPKERLALTVPATEATKNSATSGYVQGKAQVVDTETGNTSTALFYQTPKGKWYYFADQADNMKCSAYDSADARKAYAGEKCVSDDNKDSTVTP